MVQRSGRVGDGLESFAHHELETLTLRRDEVGELVAGPLRDANGDGEGRRLRRLRAQEPAEIVGVDGEAVLGRDVDLALGQRAQAGRLALRQFGRLSRDPRSVNRADHEPMNRLAIAARVIRTKGSRGRCGLRIVDDHCSHASSVPPCARPSREKARAASPPTAARVARAPRRTTCEQRMSQEPRTQRPRQLGKPRRARKSQIAPQRDYTGTSGQSRNLEGFRRVGPTMRVYNYYVEPCFYIYLLYIIIIIHSQSPMLFARRTPPRSFRVSMLAANRVLLPARGIIGRSERI